MTDSLEVTRDGDVVTVTLNGPGAGNVLDLETAHALHNAIEDAEATGALTMVLAALGKVFCAGGGETNRLIRSATWMTIRVSALTSNAPSRGGRALLAPGWGTVR
jgi:1,4-dihydroxy-2-naphthoyl-CoA synthase